MHVLVPFLKIKNVLSHFWFWLFSFNTHTQKKSGPFVYFILFLASLIVLLLCFCLFLWKTNFFIFATFKFVSNNNNKKKKKKKKKIQPRMLEGFLAQKHTANVHYTVLEKWCWHCFWNSEHKKKTGCYNFSKYSYLSICMQEFIFIYFAFCGGHYFSLVLQL